MDRKRNRQRPFVRIVPQPGQSPDDIQQGLIRWRRQLAFDVAQHPDLAAKARRLGIVLDDGEPPEQLM